MVYTPQPERISMKEADSRNSKRSDSYSSDCGSRGVAYWLYPRNRSNPLLPQKGVYGRKYICDSSFTKVCIL